MSDSFFVALCLYREELNYDIFMYKEKEYQQLFKSILGIYCKIRCLYDNAKNVIHQCIKKNTEKLTKNGKKVLNFLYYML